MFYHLFMWCICATTCLKHKTYQRKPELATGNENMMRQRRIKEYIGMFSFHNAHSTYITSSTVLPAFTYESREARDLNLASSSLAPDCIRLCTLREFVLISKFWRYSYIRQNFVIHVM